MADKVISRIVVQPGSRFSMKRRDPDETFGWDKDTAKSELADLHPQIVELQQRLAAEHRHSLLIVLQAMDACGKDGTIRAVFGALNPAGVKVASFKAPAGHELDHDYLWRVHAVTPARGEIGVWNRSHYEDVLVVRVRKLVPREQLERRYRHIREFERLLVDEGTRIVKINLNVSFEEQRLRLQDRIDDASERWKFRVGDLDDRKLWPEYMKAYEVAINETTTDDAPWYVVPGNRKWVRNLAVARILLHELKALDPRLPPDDPAIAGLIVE
jgi:PPK2 family polyphosphate:nucleotide phosphotransferase